MMDLVSNTTPHTENQTGASVTVAPGEAERLTIELKKKDQLIAALTERLEQAAELLDRQCRTGEARGAKRSAGGLPAELLADHQTVISDLKEIAHRWQEFQADIVLERIEQQIMELRELVAGNETTAEQNEAHRDRNSESASVRSSGSFRLEDSTEKNREAPGVQPTAAEPCDQQSVATAVLNMELPAPVVFDGLGLSDAIIAICERNQCILKLREKLALTTCSTECSNSPEAIQNRLTELEVIWQEKFRQHELSLSLERARLAREEIELKQKQERLAKELSRVNLAHGNGTADAAAAQENANRSRWMKFLGSGKKDKRSEA